MKKLTFVTICLISAGIFTGCKKADNYTTVKPVYASTTDHVYNATVTYSLKMNRPSTDPRLGGNPVMNWDNGYIHVSGLIFNAIYADAGHTPDKFGAQLDKTMTTFGPEVLGAVKMPTVKTSNASFTIEASPKGDQLALMLNGVYYSTDGLPVFPPARVQFIVNEPFSISSQWVTNFAVGTVGHTACMELDMGVMATGIDRGMMNNAQMKDGTIIISSTSNANIYAIMVNNLKSAMMPVNCITSPTEQPTAVTQ